MVFSKILAAIDGSDESMAAAQTAIEMAARSEAEVIALHVLEIPSFAYYHAADDTKKMIDKCNSESKEWFEKIAESAEKTKVGLKTQTVVTIAPTFSEIVNYAEKEGVDLIVMGTTGKTGFKRLLLGSVASRVVSYAHCTVMVVKAKDG